MTPHEAEVILFGERNMQGHNGVYLRRHNRSLVLWMLRNRGPISRRQISDETGLGSATVTGLVSDLLEEGLVEEVGRSPARSLEGGRNQILLDLRPAAAIVAGVHLGVRRIQVALGDQRGVLHATEVLFRPPNAGPEEAVALASQLVGRLLSDMPEAMLWGSGVSVPTVVDVERGRLPHPLELGWSDDVDLAGLVQRALPGPIALGNSRHGILLAESHFGAARGEGSAILLDPASTVGAAFMVDHKILQPSVAAASRIGHIVIDPRGPTCECGARGCLDAIAGERRLMDRARQRLGVERDPVELVELAEGGDRIAQEVLEVALYAIASATSHASLIMDIDLVLIAGWLATSTGKLFDDFRRRVVPHLERTTGRRPRILPAASRFEPQLVGAISLALDRFVYRPPDGAGISWCSVSRRVEAVSAV